MKEKTVRRRTQIAITALCEATAAPSVQICVWMPSGSRERWDRDMNGLSNTDFMQNLTRVYFQPCLFLFLIPACA